MRSVLPVSASGHEGESLPWHFLMDMPITPSGTAPRSGNHALPATVLCFQHFGPPKQACLTFENCREPTPKRSVHLSVLSPERTTAGFPVNSRRPDDPRQCPGRASKPGGVGPCRARPEKVCLFIHFRGFSYVAVVQAHTEEACPFVSPSLRIRLQHLVRNPSARGLAAYRMESLRSVAPGTPMAAVRLKKVCPFVADSRSTCEGSHAKRSAHLLKINDRRHPRRSGQLSGPEEVWPVIWPSPSRGSVSAKRSGPLSMAPSGPNLSSRNSGN
jgi:hypothetical protein